MIKRALINWDYALRHKPIEQTSYGYCFPSVPFFRELTPTVVTRALTRVTNTSTFIIV
jgi:hypothetical protein